MSVSAFSMPARILLTTAAVILASWGISNPSRAFQPVPDPVADLRPAKAGALQTAVFAGGCFWGVEAVFEQLKGVREVTSGYAGGTAASANYDAVSSGSTRHAEAVRIRFDPSVISYGRLLKVFFSVAHDPTQLDRQGPDRGPQYRSAIFYADPAQERIAKSYIAQMTAAGTYGSKKIVTRVDPLQEFYLAEKYHQDFARLNPGHPYIVQHDAPKVRSVRRQFPAMVR